MAKIRKQGRLPLVLGGDCTITLGALTGLRGPDTVGLLYLDGDADLNTPDTSGSGVLDTMGMTHMLGGGAQALARLGEQSAMLHPDNVVLFGFDPNELDTGQWARLSAQHLHAIPAPAVRENPARSARNARSHLEDRVDSFLVHLDVDVLDTGLFPLANFPHFAGLTLDHIKQCLVHFASSPKFAGLVITEVNPDHDPDGDLIRALIVVIADALGAQREPH